jgi:DNA-binding MarR family transcriptional regulator
MAVIRARHFGCNVSGRPTSSLALLDVLADDCERDTGIPLQWYDALVHLEDLPDGLRMSELAEKILYSHSDLTRVIDRMEKAGLVCRYRPESDRRSVFVSRVAPDRRARVATCAHIRRQGATRPRSMQRLLAWLRDRDRDLSALRRAGRAAVVMPALFAVGMELLSNPALATFAAFGSFAMLLLVDFGGSMRERLLAEAMLAATGAALVCLGTLASRSVWLGVATMALVGFAVLFAGVVSSVIAGATTSLLLAFILPVSFPGSISSLPDRLAGWGLASAASLLAIAFLWPSAEHDQLRAPAIAACRALVARLRADVAFAIGGGGRPSPEEKDAAAAAASEAVAALRHAFFATPYRPTGLGTPGRLLVRLVDELSWLSAIVTQPPARGDGSSSHAACRVKTAAALALERGADLLEQPQRPPEPLRSASAELRAAMAELEEGDGLRLPVAAVPGAAMEDRIGAFITALDPSFRAQELSFVADQIAVNIDLGVAAERRRWVDRLLGRRPPGMFDAGPSAPAVPSTLTAAQERAGAHVQRHSVWLHNSVRGAAGLAVAVLVAKETGVQHSFWVVLAALSVLRSNALSTGQTALRALLGTTAGFVLGGVLVALIGTNTTLLWLMLPPAIIVAGVAPAAISFAAGQAGFTLTLVILFNIIAPVGWRIGLVRIEDIAIGCAVSLAVGVLFWPRGAAAELGTALSEAYVACARYLAGAVEFGMGRCDLATAPQPAPMADAARAAAASRRLDDAFRGFLAERGSKPVPLAEVTSLITGVVGLRLAGDAVLDLWQRDHEAGGDRAAARRELLEGTQQLVDWYEHFAGSLNGSQAVPDALEADDTANRRLIDAVARDLRREDGRASATAARMIWTGDHLDGARRLQRALVDPARHARVAATAGAW